MVDKKTDMGDQINQGNEKRGDKEMRQIFFIL